MKRKLLSLIPMLVMIGLPCAAADAPYTIDQSHTMVAGSDQQQRFADYIDLAPGQEKLPLTLTFYNGSDKAPGYQWLRISIAGRPFITEQDFKGKQVCALDVSGNLGTGSSQILVLGAGPRGANLSWTLTTPKVILTSANPNSTMQGAKVTLTGKNFSTKANDDKVLFDSTAADVISASANQLVVTVPKDTKVGDSQVTVSVFGVKSSPVKIAVKAPPVVTGVSLFSGAPGDVLTIDGKNFSAKANENKVTIGGVPCETSEASTTSITTEIPMALEPQEPIWDLPVVVEVGGVKSNSDILLNVQTRNIPFGEVSPTGPRN